MPLVPVPPVRYLCAAWRGHGSFLLAAATRPDNELFLFRP